MSSPSKVKQTSLSQFYRKLQYHQQSMNLNENDPNITIFSKIHSSPQSKIHSQYSELDLQSNMKKDQKMFLQKLKNHYPHSSPKKPSPQKKSQQNLFVKENQESQINKNDKTSFDYNLSVEPEQIQIPQVQKKYSTSQNQKQSQKQKNQLKVLPTKKINILTPQKHKNNKQRQQHQKLQSQYSDVVQRLKWGQAQKINAQKSSISNIQQIKGSQHQISSPILSSDDEQGSDIFLKCNQLQSKVQSLKQQKYQFAIQKYRTQCQNQMQKQFEIQKNKIDSAHTSKVLNIQNAFQGQRSRFQKAKQDLKRYKQAYELILTELSQKKNKILQQFEQSLQKVKSYQQKSIMEWKRQSNQQIKKVLNQKTLMF